MSHFNYLIARANREAAKRRDQERAQARAAKRSVFSVELVECFDYDECEAQQISETNARYAIAH